jgi:hypothetical protein
MNCAVLTIAGIVLGFLGGVLTLAMLVSNAERKQLPPGTPPAPTAQEDENDGS